MLGALIVISFLKLHTPLTGHVVVGVVEVDVPLSYPQCEPALSGTHICMILRVLTLTLSIVGDDHFSVHKWLIFI